jgi:dipeptidyl aminopeptidase/acylaminoacyl peptidase
MVTAEKKSGVPGFYWAFDNKHVLYLKDSDGNENFHVYAAHIDSGTTRDLTPFENAKAQNLLLEPTHPHEVLVALNVRDSRCHDMYRINLETGKAIKDTENPGDVRWWLADHDFAVRAAVAISAEDSSTTLRVRDSDDKPWRTLIHWPFGETGLLEGYGSEIAVAFSANNNALFVQAAFEGNYTQLAKVDAQTGKIIKIVASHPNASIWNEMGVTLYDEAQVLFHPKTGEVQAAGFNYLKPQWKIYDPQLRKDFNILAKLHDGVFEILGRDAAGKLWTVKYYSDVSLGTYYLYDSTTQKGELLFDSAPHLKKFPFVPMKPVVITARDGMKVPCYLGLPKGMPAKNLPMVLFIHGGPWARDQWGFDGIVQFLANRGYAVLQVNFRGSAGLGKKFLNAGIGQWGTGHMQHDITDAARWFIKKGIADPQRIGIIGASYGGYAVLAGLTFTPDLYKCGVSICGIANVKTSLDAMPDWWALIKKRWIRRIGTKVLENEAENRRISPLYHADKIKAKLLVFHGVNDPRVTIEESNRIVATMRKNKKEAVYVVYPDEGHGIGRPRNMVDLMGRLDVFLAQHLGGRCEPWKKVEGSSAELR